MAYGYLKTPVPQHSDVKVAVKIYKFTGETKKVLVYSPLSGKSFDVDVYNLGSMAVEADPDPSYTVDVETTNVKPYYKGKNSLYKFAEEWNLNSWEFDVLKRIIRCRHKGHFIEDLEKTKAVIDIYLKEYGNRY